MQGSPISVKKCKPDLHGVNARIRVTVAAVPAALAANERIFQVKTYSLPLLGIAALLTVAAVNPANAAVDADAAQALAKSNDCFKCHAIDKTKKGPALKKIAEKYRGKPEGQDKIIKNITTGPSIKMPDGSEDKHKVIETKDPKELKNLADWILSQ